MGRLLHRAGDPRGRRLGGGGIGEPRLLILTPDYPPGPGGIQVSSQRYAEGIEGFETRVVTLEEPGARTFDAGRGAAVARVGAGAMPRGARNLLLNAEALRRALSFRPDVTLSMHIVTSPAAAAIRRRLGSRFVQLFHAEEIGVRPRLAAFAAREADVAVAVSSYTEALVAALGPTDAALRVVSPGVDVPADPVAVPAAEPTVLTISRLTERYKGHDTMARAWPLVLAKVPAARWVVIGEGRLRRSVEALLGAYGVAGSVSFLGAVDDEERDHWLRKAHVFAMPSRLPGEGFAGEGFGIAYLEAGAYGKPVVACNVGGALDSVIDGETGLLVEPEEPLALAAAIASLLGDGELAQRLGAAGRARAESFAWPRVAARMREVLLEAIACA
jgi:phosphatidylinositol alpha-1,6-mannosyltransferase